MGWREETYGGIGVEVPDDWGYGTTRWPPCIKQPEGPYVGRPGVIPLVGCGSPVPPLDSRVPYLWFDSRLDAGIRFRDAGWVERTRLVDDMSITVLTDDPELSERLLRSARPVAEDIDWPARHPITEGPRTRPDPGAGGLAGIGVVESVAICRYGLGGRSARLAGPVMSLSLVTGDAAAELVREILAAPEGNGPNRPGECAASVMFGDQALVLRVRGNDGEQEVFVRYSGCDGHGFDDGHTRRLLTGAALRPLLAGPHRPATLNGSVAELVWPRT
jgi:hypothetical protein